MSKVNDHLSDLFFNYDHSDALCFDDKNNLSGYDHDRMLADAETVISCVRACGGQIECSPAELVKDFMERI